MEGTILRKQRDWCRGQGDEEGALGLGLKEWTGPHQADRYNGMRTGIQAAETTSSRRKKRGLNVHGAFRACKATEGDRSMGSLCGCTGEGGTGDGIDLARLYVKDLVLSRSSVPSTCHHSTFSHLRCICICALTRLKAHFYVPLSNEQFPGHSWGQAWAPCQAAQLLLGKGWGPDAGGSQSRVLGVIRTQREHGCCWCGSSQWHLGKGVHSEEPWPELINSLLVFGL